ncbi:MAG: maleylacetoacetate isomerase [Burkholderiaceae bacterium]
MPGFGMKLYTFYQSGSAHRVRIALALKDVEYEPVYVQGGRGSQELRSPAFRQINPQGAVPVLVDGGCVLTQSIPIIEYLDETHPLPPLLPVTAPERARVRALAQLVASDIQPLIAARVLEYARQELLLPSERQQDWVKHWILHGLKSFESLVAGHPETGTCCHGNRPTLADVCLIPQIGTARRFACDLSSLPTITRIHDHCMMLTAFRLAAPENQPDAQRP